VEKGSTVVVLPLVSLMIEQSVSLRAVEAGFVVASCIRKTVSLQQNSVFQRLLCYLMYQQTTAVVESGGCTYG